MVLAVNEINHFPLYARAARSKRNVCEDMSGASDTYQAMRSNNIWF